MLVKVNSMAWVRSLVILDAPKKNILLRKCKGVFDYLGHRSSSVSGWIACFITFSKLHVATLPPMPARWCTLMQSLHTSCQFSLGLDQSRAEEFHPASEKAKPRIVSGSILAQCLPFLGLCNASWARRQELVVRDIGALTKTFAPHFLFLFWSINNECQKYENEHLF